jgi:uncharacterized protein YbbK (DUF523 family)
MKGEGKMENILISACLIGLPCRYDGKVGKIDLSYLKDKYNLIPVCPEIYGGLPTPRVPSERAADGVFMRDGTDVTDNFMRGAMAAYELCLKFDCKTAILKERSPSCGTREIYDGTFTGRLTRGEGVTAEYLRARGIRVLSEEDIKNGKIYGDNNELNR